MLSDKQIKKEFKAKASKDPDKYYATSVLKKEGFTRKKCKCGVYYWTVVDSETCGNPECSGGFRFFGEKVAKNKLDYVGVWKEFSRLFKKWGYTPIKRYPVVARWRADTDFVQASIYDFQPYVVNGEVEPPANPLVVPQFCLRFNDIDNVGITGAHYTGFVMIGQHAFMKPNEFDQEKYFSDIHNWLKLGLGLGNDEITFHEDAWAGGGNFGPCMEYFSRGLELGNQVYMLYEQTPSGNKELKLKVLDMGMGHERNAWFSQGKSTSYETTFPTVCKKLFKITGIEFDEKVMKKFLPYSSYLNIDEVESIDNAWKLVAKNIGEDVKDLKKKILPITALFSVAEHSRSLLFALNDGALPSNTGGGYNLRVILRRALGFIDRYGWKLDISEICTWHAEYLKELFPELSENLEDINEILENEKNKFLQTKLKTSQIIGKLIEKEITEKNLLQLYDSQGISPELVKEEASKLGREVNIPENFYSKVSELHEHLEQSHATRKKEEIDLSGVNDTKALYFDDYSKIRFKAKVIKQIGKYIILDETYFYPTSGGQLHDIGKISGEKVVDVVKQGAVILHVLENEKKFPVSIEVDCEIDQERRIQLAQHHTATHIIGAAARKILGSHINQAGAKKDVDKAHIDLTHYKALSEEEIEMIEKEANKIISEKIPISSSFKPRTEAEIAYGMNIYQGGAVPGKNIRIVDIDGIDVQACGGTHLNNTSEAGKIKIIKASKISDSIVRIEFTSGKASLKEENKDKSIIEEAAKILDCSPNQVPGRSQELFELWKKVVKKNKQIEDKTLKSIEGYNGDLLVKTSEILKTQPEFIIRTLKRFKDELSIK